MLQTFRWYRRMRGGRWARVTGWLWGRRWVRVSPECAEAVDEDWTGEPYQCPTCKQWQEKWQATVMQMGVDPRRRAPVLGEMYLRRGDLSPPRWVLGVEDAYQLGKTWVRYSERGGVTNDTDLGTHRVELPEWELWVRDGGELIGWRDPTPTPTPKEQA